MKKNNFLVEIGTEELPPKMLRKLAETFFTKINNELDINRVKYGKINWFATPRRIAVKVTDMNENQEDSKIENIGPTIEQAFNVKGYPTKAANGWARDCGITISQAEHLINKKGKWLIYHSIIKGNPVQNLLCSIVSNALGKLSIMKMIRWGNNDKKFIWPVRTVTLLLNENIISGKILGINIDRVVLGHRFMGDKKIFLDNANNYQKVLITRGRVIADYCKRKEKIRKDVEYAAKKLGGVADLSDSLLEEVTSLVEWPVILTAKFEEKFLYLPAEALVCTLKKDQKYFPIYDDVGNILPYFIFVANIELKNSQKIISGNEKVVRSRLSDAEFFFKTDLKQRLEDRLPVLNSVLFQKNLGTLRDKSERVQYLAAWIAGRIGADISQSARAGLLSKCDLITNMVFEFTNIQGIMGMHYAKNDNEPESVALAQKEQYYPRFSGDTLPTTMVSCAVAIAEKMDTLTGIFGIGQSSPRGNKDPFALRRIAIGVLRIIVEKKLSLDLQELTIKTISFYGNKLNNDSIVNDVLNFMFNRFCIWYYDHGYNKNIIHAVLAIRPTSPVDFDARLRALSSFCNFKESAKLVVIHKRISNILAKNKDKLFIDINNSFFNDPAEINLSIYLNVIREKLKKLFYTNSYEEALIELSYLNDPIAKFFDKVMVMTEDYQVRINRLTLLSQIHKLFLKIANISLL